MHTMNKIHHVCMGSPQYKRMIATSHGIVRDRTLGRKMWNLTFTPKMWATLLFIIFMH